MHVPRTERAETLRILFAVTVPITARAVLRGQLSYLAEHGHEVHLATSVGDPFADEADAAITMRHVVPFSRRFLDPIRDLRAAVGMFGLVRRVRPDLIVVGTPKAGIICAFVARLVGIPCLYILHGLRLEGAQGLPRAVMWLAERTTCALSTQVVAVGEQLRSTAIRLRLVSAARSSVAGHGSANGLNVQRFRPLDVDQQRDAKARLGLAPHGLVVGFVGRLTPDKGLSVIRTAWARVCVEDPEATLIMVGGVDSAVTTDLVPNGMGHLDRVVWAGEVINPEQYLQVMDVLILPSKREGLPTVVLEAAACGVPTVMSDITGARDAVAHGDTGILLRSTERGELAEAILRFRDEAYRRRLGDAARERALRLYEQTGVWRAYERAYQQMV